MRLNDAQFAALHRIADGEAVSLPTGQYLALIDKDLIDPTTRPVSLTDKGRGLVNASLFDTRTPFGGGWVTELPRIDSDEAADLLAEVADIDAERERERLAALLAEHRTRTTAAMRHAIRLWGFDEVQAARRRRSETK